MKFSIIAAADNNFGIGKNNDLPWRLRGDLKYFSRMTKDAPEDMVNAVIMGRKTWESLPENHRPLKGRLNVVLTRGGAKVDKGVILASSLDDALNQLTKLAQLTKLNEVFVIGGANVYAQAVEHPSCKKIYLTEVNGEFDCDAFFPEFSKDDFKLISRSEVNDEDGIGYRFAVYDRDHQEI